MPDNSVSVRFETKFLNVRLEKPLDAQNVEVSARDRVTITISDKLTVAQLNASGLFLPKATFCDNTELNYFYFGWTVGQNPDGVWLIRRASRSTTVEEDATFNNNGAYADLDAAWPNRLTLTYA